MYADWDASAEAKRRNRRALFESAALAGGRRIEARDPTAAMKAGIAAGSLPPRTADAPDAMKSSFAKILESFREAEAKKNQFAKEMICKDVDMMKGIIGKLYGSTDRNEIMSDARANYEENGNMDDYSDAYTATNILSMIESRSVAQGTESDAASSPTPLIRPFASRSGSFAAPPDPEYQSRPVSPLSLSPTPRS